MIGWIRKLIWGKKRKFIKTAKIVFKDVYDDVPIDSPLMKLIRIYVKGELADEEEYSDVIIDELRKEGVPILDETAEIKRFLPTVKIELGRVDL